MCTTHPSSSSSMGHIYFIDNDNDSLSYSDNGIDKEKEENFFKEIDSDSHDNIIEKSKDEHFGKVFKILIINIIII